MPIPNTDSPTSTTARSAITPPNAHRCGQPGQQHGRRIPSLSSEHTLSTCCRLVSTFLTEMVQQIHSLRASGVMSSQAASAFASDASAFRRSAGRLCRSPPEIRMVVIELSHRLKDQAPDTKLQLGFRDYRGLSVRDFRTLTSSRSSRTVCSRTHSSLWTCPLMPFQMGDSVSSATYRGKTWMTKKCVNWLAINSEGLADPLVNCIESGLPE